MAGIQDFVEFVDDFIGGETFATAGQGSPWAIADTSSAGTPTYTLVDGSQNGEISLAFDSQTEAQNVCLYNNNILWLDIDNLIEVEFRVKQGQTTADTATSAAWGVTGDRHDTIDSVAQAAIFRIIGSNAVVCESDDGTTDLDDKATGVTLSSTYKRFVISFANGKSDVRFYIDGQRVATSTTFDMSAYSGSLQLFVQLQKTSDNNTDSLVIDYVRVLARRS